MAGRVAKEMGAVHVILSVDELAEAGIEDNPVDRCYRCKKLLFQKMKKKAQELGVPVIVEGTNADDLTVYRPGIRAIRELGITSRWPFLASPRRRCVSLPGNMGFPFPTGPRPPAWPPVSPMGPG